MLQRNPVGAGYADREFAPEASRQDITRAGEEVYSMRKMLVLAVFAAALMALLGMAATSATGQAQTMSAKTVVISTRKLPKLGTVLVNSKGRTLYMFVPDKRKKVTCVKSCAVIWPPVRLPKGAKAVAAGKAKRSLLGSDPDPAGGRVVTYNRWPLYTYITDTAPGQAKGQALNLNGGLWYVLDPSGKVIRKKL
jgi:predicted lipoprotein with Yx(FWY)xxD motif